MSTKKICSNCEYFNKSLKECRLDPPTINDKGYTKWPDVNIEDWCGQFKERITIR